MLPRDFITPDGYGITDKARAYLGPLMKGEEPPPFKDGLPQYVRLKNVAGAAKLHRFDLTASKVLKPHGRAEPSTTTSPPISPWTYLGHERFVEIAARCTARRSRVKPVEPRRGLPGVGRAAAVEARAAAAGVSARRAEALVRAPRRCRINLQPKYFPAQRRSCRVLDPRGARARTRAQALALTGAVMHARCGRRSATSPTPTRCAALARDIGLDADALAARAAAGRCPRVTRRSRRRRSTRGVFGAPSYVDRRRIVLGTGPARLPGPQTGKIACFLGRPSAPAGKGEAAGSGRSAGTTGGRATDARSTKALARSLSATSSGRNHSHVHRTHLRARLRGGGDRLRHLVDRLDHGEAGRQRAHAGDRRGDPGGRQGVPQSPVHDDRHRRRHPVRDHRRAAAVGARPAASRSARSSPGSPATSA